MRTYFIGLDLGKEGAAVVQNSQTNDIEIYPFEKIGNELDTDGISRFLRKYKDLPLNERVMVVMEDLRAIFGSSAGATFSFGHVNGFVEGLLTGYQIPYRKVQAKVWQKTMFQGIPEIRKPDMRDKYGKVRKGQLNTKAMSLLASQRLFPSVSLLRTPRCKKKDHNISDALLMSEYLKIYYQNEI